MTQPAPPETRPPAAVIIPARDNADRIADVVRAVPRDTCRHVIVVDAGSTDPTREQAAAAGATVVNLPTGSPHGYGALCRAGLAHLDTLPPDQQPEVVAFFAAWDDVRPEQVTRLIDAVAGGRVDLAVGSRHLRRPRAGAHSVIRSLTTPLLRLCYGKGHTDIGPMRAIRRDALRKMNLTSPGRGWDIEMRAQALWHRLTILEIPCDHAPAKPAHRPPESASLAWSFLRTGPRTVLRNWTYTAYVTLKPAAAAPRRRGEWG